MNQQYIERYWRDATPADAIREPPMVARFCDDGDNGWLATDILLYYDRSMHPWHNNDGISYEHCQVYDAPDPGEGWRLIDVDKDIPQVGDELYEKPKNRWLYRSHDKPYDKELTYRRRIEQPKPEPRYEPFRWEDREQLRGRLITFVDHNRTVEFRCESFEVDDNMFTVNNAYADWLCKHAVFVDTKEPVGRRVE